MTDKPHLFEWREAIVRSDLPSTVKHVLLTLPLRMDMDGGNDFPSTRTLADETGLSRRTVERRLQDADEKGWIDREERGEGLGWRRYVYHPRFPNRLGVATELRTNPSVTSSTTDRGAGASQGGDTGSPPSSWPSPSDLPSENGTGHLQYPEGFERLWDDYPRQRGKKAAYRKVRSLVRDGADVDELVDAADRYRRRMESEGRDPEHVKHARTFFGPDDWWREELENPDTRQGGYAEQSSQLVPRFGDPDE